MQDHENIKKNLKKFNRGYGVQFFPGWAFTNSSSSLIKRILDNTISNSAGKTILEALWEENNPADASLIDKLIKTAVKTVGGSAITITHDMASVCRIADKVILIDRQTISWSGTPKEMFKSNNKKIKDFIKSTNPKLFI